MELRRKDPPRVFSVGQGGTIHIRDTGDLVLNPDEQITLVTDSGKRMDVARKSWGFYATPSINKRLRNEGFKTALVENRQGHLYVMVVDPEHMAEFEAYCAAEGQSVVRWLDEYSGGAIR